MDCRNVRNEIHKHLDGEVSLSAEVRKHLSMCADCRELLNTYRNYTIGLKEAIDAEAKELGEPNLSILRRHPERWNRRLLIWASAALLAVAISAPFAYRGYSSSRTKAYIREDNSRLSACGSKGPDTSKESH